MEGYTMKLTGILKDKVDKAETMEAKKDIIAEAGMELTDDELDMVAGGATSVPFPRVGNEGILGSGKKPKQ